MPRQRLETVDFPAEAAINPPLFLLGTQLTNSVVSTPNLKSPCFLEVFELEKYLRPQKPGVNNRNESVEKDGSHP